MEKKILKLNTEYEVEGNLECIELSEEGCLYVPESLEKLHIKKLINSKTGSVINNAEICVIGKDGKNGNIDTDITVNDAESCGNLEITIDEIEGDIHIRSIGGNAAVIKYNKSDDDDMSCVYYLSSEDGIDGSDEKDETIIIHHPDGGIEINGIEKVKFSSAPYNAAMVNFKDDGDFRRYIKRLGGESVIKKYSVLYDAIKNTRTAPQKSENGFTPIINAMISQVLPVEDVKCKNGADEIISSDSIFYTLDFTITSSYINSDNNADALNDEDAELPVYALLNVQVVNDTTNEILYEKFYECTDSWQTLNNITTNELPSDVLADKKLKINVSISYIGEKSVLAAENLNSEVFELKDLIDKSTLVDTIEIYDPREKQEKTERRIVFLYGRTIDQNTDEFKDADYYGGDFYKNAYDSNNKILRTIIPMKGKITFGNKWKDKIESVSIAPYSDKENNVFLPVPTLDYEISVAKMTLATMTAENGDDLGNVFQGKDDLKYHSESNSADFDLRLPNRSGISEYDWNSNLNCVFLNASMHCCYLKMSLRLHIDDGSSDGKYIVIRIQYRGDLPENCEYYKAINGNTDVYIPKIMIFWGCYADDVIIAMADGSYKKTCEINIGDVVKGFDGKALTVSSVLVGDDNEIFSIETADGKNIKVSGSHAMKLCSDQSEEKSIAASKLKIGDKLKTVSGSSVVNSVQKVPYSGKVYNFTFAGEETPNYLDANGFCAGDYYAQNSFDVKPKEQSENAKKVISVCRSFINDRNSEIGQM